MLIGKTLTVASDALIGWASLATVAVVGILAIDREEQDIRNMLQQQRTQGEH